MTAAARQVAMTAPPLPGLALLLLLLLPVAGAPFAAATGLSFKVTPSSAADPLRSKSLEVSAVTGAPPGTNWLLLQTTAGPQFSGLPAWFPLDAQHGSATISWWSEYFDRDDRGHDPVDPPHNSKGASKGSFTVQLSAWKGRNGTRLATAAASEVVHYDKGYTALRWNLTAQPRGTPGAVRLTLTPANGESEPFAAETQRCWWFRYKYTSTPKGGVAGFAEDVTIEKSLEPPTFDLSVSLGGQIYFVGIFGSFSNGISGGFPQGAPGFVSQRAPLVQLTATDMGFQPLALIIPFANGTVPSLPEGFKGPQVRLPAIAGDARFALQPSEGKASTQLTFFDGGAVSMRLFYPDTKTLVEFIELELPSCMAMQNVSKNYRYTVATVTEGTTGATGGSSGDSGGGGGHYRVRLTPYPAGRWASDQRELWLHPLISCAAPSTQVVKIRPLLTEAAASLTDNWQTLEVDVKPVPTPPKTLPHRLAPSLTWAPTYHFGPNETAEGMEASVRMFRNVGMSTIPMDGARNVSPKKTPEHYFSAEQRKASALWEGLKYGPQISSFYDSFNGMGMFEALAMSQEQMDATEPAKKMQSYGLSPAQIATELALLRNALDFHNKTGHIDVAYDGFFFHNDLNVTRQIVAYTTPDFLFVDSEQFTRWSDWLVNVGLSKNAAARRKGKPGTQGGEGDADLAYRMSKEFMAQYSSNVRDASNGATTIGFFGAHAYQTLGQSGVGSFPWPILEELGQLSQPGFYGQHNTANLQAFATRMAMEKRAVGHGAGCTRIIPWLTTATSGPISPTGTFDELVHMFLNGGSGFSYYADIDFHDMEYYLRINEAIKIVTPFEDLILDGALANVTSTTNCVVSAMGLGGEFLIGVTPLTSRPVSFEFTTNTTGKHVLTQLAPDGPGKLLQSVPAGHVVFKSAVAQTTVLHFGPA